MNDGSPDDQVFTPARRQQWRLVLMALVMTAASVFILFAAGIFGLIVGVIGVAFFGFATIYILVKAVQRGPVLVLGAPQLADAMRARLIRPPPVTSISHRARVRPPYSPDASLPRRRLCRGVSGGPGEMRIKRQARYVLPGAATHSASQPEAARDVANRTSHSSPMGGGTARSPRLGLTGC